jgi:hypothetical protein
MTTVAGLAFFAVLVAFIYAFKTLDDGAEQIRVSIGMLAANAWNRAGVGMLATDAQADIGMSAADAWNSSAANGLCK